MCDGSRNIRYVDDLATINHLYFHMIFKDIYRESLLMERARSDNKNINYLHLNINITPEGLNISVWNETDDFNFDVVSPTFLNSNIPLEVAYHVFLVKS